MKKQKKTLSKLDVGYESEDETNHQHPLTERIIQPIYSIKKSQSDYFVGQRINHPCSSLTHSLPLFEHNQLLPTWWRHSITSAYDTCSNPDIDFSIEETKRTQNKTSLLMYSKNYSKYQRMKNSIRFPLLPSTAVNTTKYRTVVHPTSNSYDASAEYTTDPEQSENDVDVLSSDFNSTSPVHHYPQVDTQFYNRYSTSMNTTTITTTTTTAMTTTTGYSSDIEFETTTLPSETEDQQAIGTGETRRMTNVNVNHVCIETSVVFYPMQTDRQ
jgi:hypothetical protein